MELVGESVLSGGRFAGISRWPQRFMLQLKLGRCGTLLTVLSKSARTFKGHLILLAKSLIAIEIGDTFSVTRVGDLLFFMLLRAIFRALDVISNMMRFQAIQKDAFKIGPCRARTGVVGVIKTIGPP